MKRLRLVMIFAIICVLLLPAVPAIAEETKYTYTYDFWGIDQASPDPYNPVEMVCGSDLGVSNLKEPQGMYIRDNRIFICDTGNNRILIVEYKDGRYSLVKEVSSVIIDGEESQFNSPMDIFQTKNGDIYICDMKNQRILHLDSDCNYIMQINKPVDGTITENAEFLPCKLVVDNAERVYVQAQNVNKGLMEFDSQGDFSGYVGANKVQVNLYEYFKKKFSTKEQRAQMELFVPTEYNNVAIDEDGFMYVTTSTFEVNTIKTANPIRRLNSQGTDILIRNGWSPPIGDLEWDDGGGVTGCSRFIDIVAMEYDSYCALDKTRGRLFMYDFQGNLLYAFGGIGNKLGSFLFPVAVCAMGSDLYVLDSRAGSFTRFELSHYGTLISNGIGEYKKGNYELSAEYWEEVLMYNGNYDLAYIGIGRALLRQDRYKEAMHYFKLKRDDKDYSKAFQLYRKEWIEDNIEYIVVIVLALVLLPKIVRLVKKIKKEVFEDDSGINEKI